MSLPVYAVLTVALVGLATVLLLWLLTRLKQHTYWKRRGILHLESSSFIGMNGPFYLGKRAFANHTSELYAVHPGARYYGAFDFGTPVLVLKDPELLRDVCVKNFEHFHDHKSFVTEEMDPIVGRNIFSLTGPRWKEVRNTLTPSFTASKMKIMYDLVSECSQEFVRHFEEHPEEALNLEAKDIFTRYTNDVIATAAFGIEVNSVKDQTNEFYLYSKDATSFSGSWKLLKLITLRTFPKLMRLFGMKFMSRATDAFFHKLIVDTVKTREERGIVRQDMIHLLMQAKNREDGIEVTIDDIIGQAFIFLLAGFDASSTLMCFLAYVLASHPDVQEKVQREIDAQPRGERGEFAYESLGQMKYLDMVISETLRMYPTTPITDRVCNKRFVLPGCVDGGPECEVELGTNLVIPIYGMHKDARYFPEPDKFIPERFSDENKDKINPYTYMPFGLGPRKCIGNRFALMETKTLFIHILRKYTITMSDRTTHPLEFCKGLFNIKVEGGLWVKLEERKKKE